MEKIFFYKNLNVLLIKILNWLITNQIEPQFDLDTKYNQVSTNEKLQFNNKFDRVIYSYLDIVCDAKIHEFTNINKNYSFNQCISDLKYIISMIEKGEIEHLENDLALLKRLKIAIL